jgi:hypothetical protein
MGGLLDPHPKESYDRPWVPEDTGLLLFCTIRVYFINVETTKILGIIAGYPASGNDTISNLMIRGLS